MALRYNCAVLCEVSRNLRFKCSSKKATHSFDIVEAQGEQRALANALKKCGVTPFVIKPDDNYPECCFVEDCAVLIGDTALITRPADQHRRGEVGAIRKFLYEELGLAVQDLKIPNALLDGGDVLFTGKEIFVGYGTNTNWDGASAVAHTFKDYSVYPIKMTGSLHLKNLISVIGTGILVVGNSPESDKVFKQIQSKSTFTYQKVKMDTDLATNMLFVNGQLIHRSHSELGPQNYSIIDEKITYNRHEVSLVQMDKLGRTLSSLCLLVNKQKQPDREILSDATTEDITQFATVY